MLAEDSASAQRSMVAFNPTPAPAKMTSCSELSFDLFSIRSRPLGVAKSCQRVPFPAEECRPAPARRTPTPELWSLFWSAGCQRAEPSSGSVARRRSADLGLRGTQLACRRSTSPFPKGTAVGQRINHLKRAEEGLKCPFGPKRTAVVCRRSTNLCQRCAFYLFS